MRWRYGFVALPVEPGGNEGWPTQGFWYSEVLRIANINQIEAVRRSRDTSTRAITSLQNTTNPLRGLLTITNGH